MDHRIPQVGTAISVLLAIGALITFVFLNNRFEGPDPAAFLGDPYTVKAEFDNTKTLPTKQPVLHRGVRVGRVRDVSWDRETETGVVTFILSDEVAPIYDNATVVIGERSLLGDAYLNLKDPGDEHGGTELAGDGGDEEILTAEAGNVEDPVNFDEALDFLDDEGQEHVRSLIETIADGASPAGNDERLSGTVGGISLAVTEVRELIDVLRGQEDEIGRLVSGSATVLGELGDREAALRNIVGGGRATLDALRVNTDSLEQAIDELPRLLASGRSALAAIRPLAVEAGPVLAKLRVLAPDLVPAFEEGAPFSIGPLSRDLIAVIEGLGPMADASERVMPDAVRFAELLLPAAIAGGVASRNAVPVVDYLVPRIDSIGNFFALGTGVVANRDEISTYSRFSTVSEEDLMSDNPNASPFQVDGTCPAGDTFCYNAYPLPFNALDNQPFQPPYPRLEAWDPPPRASVLRGGGR